MNQTDFAAIANVTRRSQSNYETGERTPDTSYLVAISAAGADVNFIITGERKGEPTPVPTQAKAKGADTINMQLMSIAIRELEAALQRNRKTLDPERKARAVGVLYEYLEKMEKDQGMEQAAVDRFMEALF